MSDDKSFNIFQPERSKMTKQPLKSASSQSTPIHVDNKAPPPLILDREIKEMVDRMRKMHDEIALKLDDAYQQTGFTPGFIKNYLNNPNNFPSSEWERVQKERKALLSSVCEELKKGIRSTPIESNRLTQKELSNLAKERRSKTLGARRNWIPMH